MSCIEAAETNSGDPAGSGCECCVMGMHDRGVVTEALYMYRAAPGWTVECKVVG